MPVHHNRALDPHRQTPMSLPHYVLRFWLLILKSPATRLQHLPRRLNTARIETLRRTVIRASYVHCAYPSFAQSSVAITGMTFMKLFTPSCLWLDLPRRNQHRPRIPSTAPSHHPKFLLVSSGPRGNSSKTEELGPARSIRQERCLNFRESSILLWCISCADIGPI